MNDAKQRANARLVPEVVRKIRDEFDPVRDRIHGLWRSVQSDVLESDVAEHALADERGVGSGP